MSTELTTADGEIIYPVARSQWDNAARRGLEARQEREQIVGSVLRAGSDYGLIPGTSKPTLLKPGAEKIVDALELYPDYEQLKVIEDFETPLFFYRYKCLLRQRGTNHVVATGIGSCNSREARYRWRSANRKCPKCGKETIIKQKEEKGGNFICLGNDKGGCWARFDKKDPAIIGQAQGKVENDDIFTLTNTIDKMSQKRAMIAAALNLGFSEQFTQDMEDLTGHHEATSEQSRQEDQPSPPQAKVEQPAPPDVPTFITAEQGMQLKNDMTARKINIKWVLAKYGATRFGELTVESMDDILTKMEMFGKVCEWSTWLETDPTLAQVNARLPEIEKLKNGTRKAVWEIVIDKMKSVGYLLSADNKTFYSPNDFPV